MAERTYHLGLGFLLQRFAGYLNHINRMGDILGESRGGKEDRFLKESYSRVFERGAWMTDARVFQSALTSGELKLKPKSANIAGLQLSDLLGHPVKQWEGLLDSGATNGGGSHWLLRTAYRAGSEAAITVFGSRSQSQGIS